MIKLKSLFRRGQTPSSSAKYGQQPPPGANSAEGAHSADPSAPLKGSSSTSNIDGLGLSKADRKKQKDFGSRDNLERKEHKSSKDRLVENLRGHSKAKAAAKEAKKHSKQEATAGQMSVVQQQQQHQQHQQPTPQLDPASSGAYEHQRPAVGGYGIVDASLVKELAEINFDGPHGDGKSIQLHELRLHLDRVTAEKKAVECQLAEMSGFQSEVMALRSEMSNMKVSARIIARPLFCNY